MQTDALVSSGAFEVAHALPDRVRLRWRGHGDPDPELLERIYAIPGVERVDYRPASRSVVVHGRDGRAGPGLPPRSRKPARNGRSRGATDPDAPGPAPERGLLWPPGPVDVDGLLTVALVATWLADLITSRTIRLMTLPLLVLAGITGYRLYERQQRRTESDIDDTSELMLLAG